jgi:multidrug transporter EmrE-like cation transporter
LIGYLFIALNVVLTVYSQFIAKWQVSLLGVWPESIDGKIHFLGKFLSSFWTISALVASFSAFLAWAVALSKLEVSHAYPFISSTFVLVSLVGWFIFHESFSIAKLIGLMLIVLGIVLSSQS